MTKMGSNIQDRNLIIIGGCGAVASCVLPLEVVQGWEKGRETPDKNTVSLLPPWKENVLTILPTGHPQHNANYTFTLKQNVPEGIRIGQTAYGWGLFADRPFRRGEVIYHGCSVTIPHDLNACFLVITDQGEFETDAQTHSCRKGESDSRWLYGFDGFYNHSCSPNSFSTEELVTDDQLNVSNMQIQRRFLFYPWAKDEGTKIDPFFRYDSFTGYIHHRGKQEYQSRG
jgi:hypothetical protein